MARVAVARKIATYIYYVLKEGKDFKALISYRSGDLGSQGPGRTRPTRTGACRIMNPDTRSRG